MEKSWHDAIIKVLSDPENVDGLHYSEISEKIFLNNYYETSGATPSITVNARISESIKKDKHTPYKRIGKGRFTINPSYDKKTSKILSITEPEKLEKKDSIADSIINSFGMYWKRDLIIWRPSEVKILGKQSVGAKPVNFHQQRGIYILYDYHAVVYVGRVIDRPMGKRLYEHTIDRLNSRWNRFSWFGHYDVTEDGKLREELPSKKSLASLTVSLEAILIEALEPPQNRRRGDAFTEKEYIQETDPELKDLEIKKTLGFIEQKLYEQKNH